MSSETLRPVIAGVDKPRYAYLGPSGTFTEAALLRVPGAADAERIPVANQRVALEKLRAGEVHAAMIPVENSVEGGVPATLDAITRAGDLRIIFEVVIPVDFQLVALPGTRLEDVTVVSTHGHAWAQTREWFDANHPGVDYVSASSTAAAGIALLDGTGTHQAAVCAPIVAQTNPGLVVLADGIGDNPDAVTRFILVARPGNDPAPTGADKTTVVIPLPDDHPGALMDILSEFASRGVNLSWIQSRPTGQYLGHYYFNIDAEGHIADARIQQALAGIHRISPSLKFLGSYARADRVAPAVEPHNSDQAFSAASQWVDGLYQPGE